MNRKKKCFAIIISCFKNINKINNQATSNLPFDYSYFLGQSNQDSSINKPHQKLDCKDNYESLIFKVFKAIQWVNKNEDYDYILKTDDDIIFNKEKINSLYKNIYQSDIDYTGFFNVNSYTLNKSYYSNYHFGKCEDQQINNTPVLCPAMNTYASGGAYFLSKKAVNKYLNEFPKEDKKLIFEDLLMGKILNSQDNLKIERGLNNEFREAFKWE